LKQNAESLTSKFTTKVVVPLQVAKQQRNELQEELQESRASLLTIAKDHMLRKKAVLVIEYLIAKKYDKVIELFENTITSALMDLFDDSYKFKFMLGKRGDSTIADFGVKTSKYKNYKDVRMTQGTALKEIVSTIMRTVIVKLDNDMPNFIILDEPFGGVKLERQILAGQFLKKVCKTFGLQYIIVSQSQEFAESAGDVKDLREIK